MTLIPFYLLSGLLIAAGSYCHLRSKNRLLGEYGIILFYIGLFIGVVLLAHDFMFDPTIRR